MAGVVLDTTVLVDVLRGSTSARTWLDQLIDVPFCSEVSRTEVIRGLRTSERGDAERLFVGLDWVPVTEPIARLAGELGRQLRRSHAGVTAVDLIVASTASALDATVATANVRHFPMFRGLRPPY